MKVGEPKQQTEYLHLGLFLDDIGQVFHEFVYPRNIVAGGRRFVGKEDA